MWKDVTRLSSSKHLSHSKLPIFALMVAYWMKVWQLDKSEVLKGKHVLLGREDEKAHLVSATKNHFWSERRLQAIQTYEGPYKNKHSPCHVRSFSCHPLPRRTIAGFLDVRIENMRQFFVIIYCIDSFCISERHFRQSCKRMYSFVQQLQR